MGHDVGTDAWASAPVVGALAVVAAGGSTATDAGLVERWRDLGPVLWLVAAAGAVVWLLLLGALVVATRPRRVEPGPATLDPGGPEPPAVVNLLTNGWRLGHESVPATLLDLAARGLVAVDQVGPRTLVRVRSGRPQADLAPYEGMVLDHVTRLATDGVVPAAALTTGPETTAKRWWRAFRKAVERDARRRGLSRRRWSPGTHAVLTLGALAVAGLVAVAATTLPDDPADDEDSPIGAAIVLGFVTAGAGAAAVELLNGERDTAKGREAAARWLGLRTLLAEDPLFAEQPPAAVAIWDRLLAAGAAMGVAHGAVRALPLGAERDDEAWSPVGGQWRVVRIRYPRFVPPGYGRHPALVAVQGLFQLGLAVLAFPAATAAADALLDAVRDLSPEATAPAGLQVAVTAVLGVVVALAVVLGVRGGSMLLTGAVDLVSRWRPAEGLVLRVRRRGSDDHPRWYVAVDDGTADRIRAWQVSAGSVGQGSTARANVTRWLAHVRDLEAVGAAPLRPALAGAAGTDHEEDDDDNEDGGVLASPLGNLLGTVGSALAGIAADAPAAAPPEPLPRAPAGVPPPLPPPERVSALVGRRLSVDSDARPHPLAHSGASMTYSAADGTNVHVAWVDPSLLQAHRSMPRFLRRPLDSVGDEAYRALLGGGVVGRRGDHVAMVMGRLPGADDDERDRALEAVAREVLAPRDAAPRPAG